jgi:drug/metabolite transporter (DMT)-like permease
MYKQTWFIVAFSIFTALMGVFITFGRKYMFKKHDVETVYFVDLFLSGILFLTFMYKFGNTKNIYKNIKKFDRNDYLIITATSVFLAGASIFGGKILKHNDISYLTLLDTAIDILASFAIAYAFYGEKLDAKKLGGLILILGGVFTMNF